jgi:hypothetical protein
MRIRTILAAAAAPAALAAVLLGTAGQASAAVVPTVASVQAQSSVYATTHENGLADTTGVDTGSYVDANGQLTKDSSQSAYGPAWAIDNVERQLTATPDTVNGGWNVTLHTVGSYQAFANPITGVAQSFSGRMESTSTWHVDKGYGAPSKANLAGQTDPTLRSQNIVAQFFGLNPNSSAVHGAITGTWLYYGVPGAPGGVYGQ